MSGGHRAHRKKGSKIMKKYEVSTNGKRIASFKNQREAEAFVRNCERQDRYDVQMGYGFPNGMPVYTISKVA